MKLSVLHEFNFMPRLDPKQAKKYGINDESQHAQQFPQRSGNLETPPANPRHREFMGVEKDHGTMAQKRGRPQSKNTRPTPNKLGQDTFQELGQPYERGIENNTVGDDAELHSIDQNDPLGRGTAGKDGYSVGNGPAQDPGRQRSSSPSMRRPQPGRFGKRYPTRS